MSDLDRFARRIQSMIGRGRVTLVDDSSTVQSLQVKYSNFETTDSRLRVGEFGHASNPPIGSEVVVLHAGGDRSSAMVVGTNHQESRPTGLLPGESMIYSQDGKQIYLTASGGIVIEAKGQNVTINDAANVTINATTVTINSPDEILMNTKFLKISGDLITNYPANPKDLTSVLSAIGTHTHGGVTIGAGSTSVPNETF